MRRTGNIVMPDPKVDIYGVENSKKRQAPANSVNDDLFAAVKELVDNCAEEKKVNERPRLASLE